MDECACGIRNWISGNVPLIERDPYLTDQRSNPVLATLQSGTENEGDICSSGRSAGRVDIYVHCRGDYQYHNPWHQQSSTNRSASFTRPNAGKPILHLEAYGTLTTVFFRQYLLY